MWLQVLQRVDEVEVAKFVASKKQPEGAAERKEQKQLKEKKDALTSALHHKCKCALAAQAPAGELA